MVGRRKPIELLAGGCLWPAPLRRTTCRPGRIRVAYRAPHPESRCRPAPDRWSRATSGNSPASSSSRQSLRGCERNVSRKWRLTCCLASVQGPEFLLRPERRGSASAGDGRFQVVGLRVEHDAANGFARVSVGRAQGPGVHPEKLGGSSSIAQPAQVGILRDQAQRRGSTHRVDQRRLVVPARAPESDLPDRPRGSWLV